MGRVGILTGVQRRRGWSDDRRLAILDKVASGGLDVSAIARRQDILAHQIYAWRRQLRSSAGADHITPILLPATVVAAEPVEQARSESQAGREKAAAGRSGWIEIRFKGGRVLKVEAGLDGEVLRGLIRSVEGA
jgi:transposase